MKARDYQEKAIAGVFDGWQKNRHLVGTMATGGGKTFCFAEIIRQSQPCRTLILSHMGELVAQIENALDRLGIQTDIEKAEQRASTNLFTRCNTVIATPQTLYARGNKRLARWEPKDFDLLIIDELHYFVAPAFKRVVKYFQEGNPNLRTLGVTATPNRHDNQSLKSIVDEVAFKIPLIQLIKEGWLVPIKEASATLEGYDLSQCGHIGEDFHQGELSQVLEQDKVLLCMADEINRRCDGKRTLVFAQSVKQGQRLAQYINNHKTNCADFVCGETPPEKRADIFARFRDGRLEKMVNVRVAGIGYDNPAIEVIAMCRPTLSTSLFEQFLGRGTRALEGLLTPDLTTPAMRKAAIAGSSKPFVTILDFKGNFGRHNIASVVDVLEGKISEEAKKIARKKLDEEGGFALEILEAAEIEAQKQLELARLGKIKIKATYSLHYSDPFAEFQQRQQKYKDYKQFRLSARQRARLLNSGWKPDEHSLDENIAQCDKLNQPSKKQVELLMKCGYFHDELDGVTIWEASKMIDACKKNGWRRMDKI